MIFGLLIFEAKQNLDLYFNIETVITYWVKELNMQFDTNTS